jgi:ABC-type transporter Mla subunit MlaD
MLNDLVEDGTMRQSKKIHTAAIGMLCITTLTIGACVSQSTYKTATVDLEAAKAELNSARTETEELTQQVNELQQHKSDLAKQMVVASSALDQARKVMKAEHAVSQKRLSSLTRSIQQLTTEQKKLRYAVKHATKEQTRLQSAVESHRSQLAEAERISASPVSSPPQPANEPAKTAVAPPAQSPVPAEPAPKPTVITAAAPVNQPAVAPKPPLANNPPPEPVEEDWLSFLKNWIASLWQSVVFF